ncbi:transglycosylase SLT domain-containing protein [Pseudohalioglobus lutimaris]|uniref:Murein transglycosylase n=1 Tax=Pseudohalioglobus lutimaris TaxID=1737061 RepID=A0A2N5X4I3_9GAMM|nr:transglycosylase SLT domain-containing protein [Pseudohalioglobus lutimaris]PLW69382.1 murein transglycosylase [Pseudohalioglobus lutimaris]
MRFQASLAVYAFFLSCGLQAAASAGLAEGYSSSRDDYSAAVRAIDRGQWTEYQKLRPGLDEYPLAVYLDYQQLSRQVSKVRPADARRFISASEDTPLPNRFLVNYLRQAGKERRWKDFLAVMPDEPNSVDLKCYYFRATLAQGDKLAAWEGAERLWVHGQSRPKPCDPLFAAWLKADQLSDDVVWARLLKAFDARERSLMSYVARKGSDALRPWSERLLAVYRKPASLRDQALPANSEYSADIATHGLAYLARYNPAQARDFWQRFSNEQAFTEAQQRKVEYAIAQQSLFSRTEANLDWLPAALKRLQDDKLVEIRLRWALREQDWDALSTTLPLLSAQGREKAVWRYWYSRYLSQIGEDARARELLQVLAGERDYYGFLAADRLGKSYSFNNRPLVLQSASTDNVRQLPAVQRIGELNYHSAERDAHSEWFKVLQDTEDTDQHHALAALAVEQGWHRMAIDAASRARAWDALDVRFPTPYQDTFQHYASLQKVPATELMAIARRESAFFPEARSPVGARGLMQVMPATGKQVASSLGRPHTREELYLVEHNVLLGSAYYRQLLDRFQGNRVFALAAYNAGPHRVDRWRNKQGKRLPVELWIETIPYRETRNYVQAVLSYNVVFQYRLGDTSSLLSTGERRALY